MITCLASWTRATRQTSYCTDPVTYLILGTQSVMSQEKIKLDHLCQLLDKIIIQQNIQETITKDKTKCPQTQNVHKDQPKKTPAVLPPTSNTPESREEKSREEVQLARKTKKEGKKARKKGEDGEKSTNEMKTEQKHGLSATTGYDKNAGNQQKPSQKTEKKQQAVKQKPAEVEKQHTARNHKLAHEAEKKQQAANKQKPVQEAVKKQQAASKEKPVQEAVKKHESVTNQKSAQEVEKQQPPQVLGTSDEGAAAGKSKADLKRERREKQEAQRAMKIIAKTKHEEEKQQKNQLETQSDNKTSTVKKKKPAGEGAKAGREKKSGDKRLTQRRIPLLGHLTPPVSQVPQYPVNSDTIHPAVRTLGIKMKDRIIDGSTARVLSTLAALKGLINDYRTPESCDLSRDLAEKLAPNVTFLNACRPQAIAMDNAIRFLQHKVNSISPSMPEGQAKAELRTAIDEYVRENISLASSTIASHAASLMHSEDVILTFGYSALVCDVVEATCASGNLVSVVVADSPHPPSGLAMVQRLAALKVTTYYRLITDITNIIDKVTKVVVEAEAVMMNGAIQGLCGTASLALAAATHHKPFIVLCHTYKFCNNDLTDSLVVNELGDADPVVWGPPGVHSGQLAGWHETNNLNVVSLVYDVTPASLVTALVTEQSVLPTSAVPVIIRRNYADVLGQD